MKALKPSMREKKRYLFVKGKNLKLNVEKAILEFLGIFGMSKVSLNWINSGQGYAIVSVNRKMVDSVRAAFAVYPEKISVTKVSGTIKGLGK